MNLVTGKSGNRGIDSPIARRERDDATASNVPINYQITHLPDDPIDRRARGFTLIELVIVTTILIILAGIALVQYRDSVTRSREGVLKTDLFRMRDAIDQYYADKGQYPGSLDELVSSGYMRQVPEDPFTRNSSSWQTIPSEPDPNNPTATPGVYDVKSGSDQTALDGTKYADW